MDETPKPAEEQKGECPTQQEFLQGRKIEVEYTGPIEVYLPQKQLLILSKEDFEARYEGETFNGDYILVDPDRFNVAKWRHQDLDASGYKGLRRGEPVILGRDNPLRFPDLSPQVSGKHLRLEVLEGGRIAIEDLASTNGTIVRHRK